MANLDLKQLSKIIDLCRKKGVESIEIDGVKLTFGDAPILTKRSRNKIDHDDPIIESPFSEEQTLLWSVSGLPPMEGAG